MNESKVSIIMGVHNCENTLSEAIESILDQTYINWELIICDDASTDKTYEIAQKYKDKFEDKIILIKNEENMFLAYSLNRCLEYAEGQYIARMDGDDISVPERLEKQVLFLREHPDVDLVGTSMQQFNESGPIRIICKPQYPDRWILKKDMPFNHATIMTYKKVYEDLGGYTVAKRTRRGQDYDLWFRFFAKGMKGANIDEPLYLVREDNVALKRRSFKARWSTFSTTVFGYRLLNYPKYWLLQAFITTLCKSVVPYGVVGLYRNYQQKNYLKR